MLILSKLILIDLYGSTTILEPYHSDLFDLIMEVLLRLEHNTANYSQLYSDVNSLAGKGEGSGSFSHRDYSTTLQNMVNNNFLIKLENREKPRGAKIYYQLTQNARVWHQRGVLDKDEKLKKLYQFILILECITDMVPVTKAQLQKALRYVDATEDDLVQESNTKVDGTNVTEVIYKNRGPIRLVKTGITADDGVTIWKYSLKEDGISMKEVMNFLKSKTDYNHFLIADLKYTRAEVKEGIRKLDSYGLLKPATSYEDKLRHRINDGDAQEMIHEVWRIHYIESKYLSTEWDCRKPTAVEGERLKSLFGRHQSQHIINKSYFRRKRINASRDNSKIVEGNRVYNGIVNALLKIFYHKYGHIIKDNFLFSDMVQSVIVRQQVSD